LELGQIKSNELGKDATSAAKGIMNAVDAANNIWENAFANQVESGLNKINK
jgi:hypothetical protein